MARRAGTAQVVTIYWRDIPAQVNGQSGRERHQVVLSSKFQRAIDRAKRKAKIYTAEEDIAQWRRETSSCDGDAATAADAEAARLEREISREYLGRLAYAGGFAADVDQSTVDRGELLALEELEEPDDESADAPTTNTDGSTEPTEPTEAADPAGPATPEQEAT